MQHKLKVLVVDDSHIFRNAIATALNGDGMAVVVGTASDGLRALEFINNSGVVPDLVTLDLEMPNLDGLETLKAIQEINAARGTGIGVIMVSSHTVHGAVTTMKALEAGAFDFIVKPNGGNPVQNMEILRSNLLVKVRYFAITRNKVSRRPTISKIKEPSAEVQPGRVEAVVIGISTGGPQSLATFLPALCDAVDVPILIVQHMPPIFTEILAKNLAPKCRHDVREAVEGAPVTAKKVYIAPGGKHMAVRQNGNGSVRVSIKDTPPENGCKPSADVLFRTASEAYSGNLIGVILTGMGSDGSGSLSEMKRAGAHLIAQDEATSVVWGMPKSALETGFVDEVLPLMRIPEAVRRFVEKRERT